MNAEFIKDTISTLIYLLPLVALVWKGGKLAERFAHLEADVKEKTGNMEKRIEEESKSTDMAIDTLMNTLTEIQKSLVRVETKLEERK